MMNMETTAQKTIKILLVEDHIMARMGTALYIKNNPEFDLVGQAEDGLQAIDLASRLNPDVILMDIGLPKIKIIFLPCMTSKWYFLSIQPKALSYFSLKGKLQGNS